MLIVLILAVEKIENDETTTTTTNWWSWNENMKMIIEFDFRTCLFVEDMIDSMIDHFIDVSEINENDFFRFFLIQMTDETR